MITTRSSVEIKSNQIIYCLFDKNHPTQLRSHLNTSEVLLRWDHFSPCKHLLPGCPT